MSYINLTKEQEKAVKIVVKDAKHNAFNDGAPLCSIRQGRHLIVSNWNKFVIIHTDACSNFEDGDYSVELVGKTSPSPRLRIRVITQLELWLKEL